MERKQLLYDGKEKQLYATADPDKVIILYKDDAAAYYGVKRASIPNKGVLNNKITELIFVELERNGIHTHFIERLDDRNQLCKKTAIIPLEFIVRNVIAGSLSRHLDLKEGTVPPNTIFEICMKCDYLRDPLINDHHAVAMGIVSYEDLKTLYEIIEKINKTLIELFKKINITVVDFKLEFGRDEEGRFLLADEISPDSARFWDTTTKERLDKDRFRKDIGNLEDAYSELLHRLETIVHK
ncbi:MAG: phosphoribosylaminoimidazolesuccinocarboxamide synthase [Bacteroidales bacterium]|nr:phosphoribosylaminoimidazolesuccinocarboxamide synthase [Bacteroidales bacterium]